MPGNFPGIKLQLSGLNSWKYFFFYTGILKQQITRRKKFSPALKSPVNMANQFQARYDDVACEQVRLPSRVQREEKNRLVRFLIFIWSRNVPTPLPVFFRSSSPSLITRICESPYWESGKKQRYSNRGMGMGVESNPTLTCSRNNDLSHTLIFK